MLRTGFGRGFERASRASGASGWRCSWTLDAVVAGLERGGRGGSRPRRRLNRFARFEPATPGRFRRMSRSPIRRPASRAGQVRLESGGRRRLRRSSVWPVSCSAGRRRNRAASALTAGPHSEVRTPRPLSLRCRLQDASGCQPDASTSPQAARGSARTLSLSVCFRASAGCSRGAPPSAEKISRLPSEFEFCFLLFTLICFTNY